MSAPVDYTQPLADPRLECAAEIYRALMGGDMFSVRRTIAIQPFRFLAMLAEARRQTGADEMVAVLCKTLDAGRGKPHALDSCTCEPCAIYNEARAALAAYDRIAE